MKKLPDNFIDAVVTDPPYGLNFMGKNWDHGVPGVEFWKEALRIAKPGAHLLSFGGTRTFHRIACAIEDAGWEIRDTIMWVYGSGFPKSMDISKAIDKKLGASRAERGGVGDHEGTVDFGMKNRCPKCGKPYFSANPCTCPREDKVAITEEAKKWSGWGTCLKPAYEPVIMARKPLEGTVADNVLKYGTGGINIDDCRVPTGDNLNGGAYCKNGHREKGLYGQDRDAKGSGMFAEGKTCDTEFKQPSGRFPANIIHDGSEEVLDVFPDNVKGGTWNNTKGARHFENNGKPTEYTNKGSDGSVGSAARFFYAIKPECEPVIMARKPIEGTVADNVLKYGTGGINIDECRVPTDKPIVIHSPAKDTLYDSGHKDMGTWTDNRGRFPANVDHDGSEEVENLFPGDPESSPARFFYC
jgi:site-specific DNA-methyltransferase (adenine-specific)